MTRSFALMSARGLLQPDENSAGLFRLDVTGRDDLHPLVDLAVDVATEFVCRGADGLEAKFQKALLERLVLHGGRGNLLELFNDGRGG